MPPKSIPLRPPPSAETIRTFQQRLLRWFRRHGRDLPWRKTRNPYHVLVSEVMLQQTQVSRVEQYYPGFLARYPTLDRLAAASPAEVRESWDGLGYYRRAANLHRFAVTVVEDMKGEVPRSSEALRRLPGIGRYTAGAIASFAFEQPEAAVDTNVSRVIRRAFFSPRAKPSERRVWGLAATLVPPRGKTAWAFNQAIMELGALICTARVARCGKCPVSGVCRGVIAASRRPPTPAVPAARSPSPPFSPAAAAGRNTRRALPSGRSG
ncbi:MAG: A/G-specific adenine glycosylase [Gemmatimonadota bacterium]